jgi:hypothetical protein
LAQPINLILESHDEQTELLRQLVANSARGANGARNAPAPARTTYGDFAATHPPLFTKAGEPLEADHWLRVMEFTFELLHALKCRRPSSPHSNCVVTPAYGGLTTPPLTPTDYQVPWAEFRNAFRAHYIPVDMMRKKQQEFMDLKQGGRFVHNYSKQFNHLVQYALDQVDTDDKKKDHFMIGLSTKLQERMWLNTGGTFSEFVSNVMIADDAIRAPQGNQEEEGCSCSIW